MVESVLSDMKELTNAKGVSLQIFDPWGQHDAVRRTHHDDRIGRIFLSTLNRTSIASTAFEISENGYNEILHASAS